MKDFESMTMYKKVGCGSIFVIFNEDDGSFSNLTIKGDNAKETPCGESFLNSLAAILTYALRRSVWEGTTKRAIVKHLCGHRCNMAAPNKEHIVSCSDAVGRCVLEYIKARGLDEIEEEKPQKAD